MTSVASISSNGLSLKNNNNNNKQQNNKSSLSFDDVLSEDDDDRNELLEYDMWEGQFSLTEDATPTSDDKDTPTNKQRGVAKDVKNARNQQKVLDRVASQDLDTLKHFDYDAKRFDNSSFSSIVGTPTLASSASVSAADKRLLLRQLSSFDSLFSNSQGLPYNRLKDADYVLCWQQQQVLNEELSEEVHMLQQQVGHLAESQASTDDKYSKVKQDNSTLTARIHMLEEHIRELELRSEERLEQEQKRNREIVQRIEREKQLEIENYAFRLQSLEKDHSNLQEEASHLRSSLERLKQEKRSAEDYLIDAQQGLSALKERHLKLEEVLRREQETFQGERSHNEQLVRELNKEVEDLRSQLHLRRASAVQRQTSSDVEVDFLPGEELLQNSSPARLAELQEELQAFRDRQRVLEKENEDLKGQILNRSVEEGKSLLDATGGLGVHGSSNGGSNSLAEEFKQMSENEIRTALKDQQDVNVQLRSYIDGILMNIIEKYPELLEVRK